MEPVTTFEHEARYLCGPVFESPAQLAGMPRVLSQPTYWQRDRYFDTADGRLRQLKANLRLREKQDVGQLATFKLKLADTSQGKQAQAAVLREEVESSHSLPQLDAEHAAVARALQLLGETDTSQLTECFALLTLRTDHLYQGERGSITLSHDQVAYGIGPLEYRVEAEVSSRDPELLAQVEAELLAAYPELSPAPRGKAGEARYRLKNKLAG